MTSLGVSSAGAGSFTAGYQATRGWGSLNTKIGADLDTPAKNVGVPEYLTGPNAETQFREEGIYRYIGHYSEDGVQNSSIVPLKVSNHKCPDLLGSKQEFQDHIAQGFVKSNQNGYKTRTQDPNNLKTGQNFPSCGDELPHPKYFGDKLPQGKKISMDICNEEYVTFKKGYRHVAPDNGRNLPGALTTNLKGSNVGPQFFTWPRRGFNPNGRYSGWQSAKYNDNGLVYSGKTN